MVPCEIPVTDPEGVPQARWRLERHPEPLKSEHALTESNFDSWRPSNSTVDEEFFPD